MCAQYRVSRNLEASVIEYIDSCLDSNWSGITVTKSFAKSYTTELPVICVRIGETSYDRAEIGSTSIVRKATLLIDIFGDSMGLTLDLKDYLISCLKDGCTFYEFTTVRSGRTTVVDDQTASGRISFLDLRDRGINFDGDRDRLPKHDQNRWLITGTISLGQVE